MSTDSTDSIPLYLASQKAYIWDPDHAATLRVTHHIGALATGTLPGVAQQNVFLGLPLVVMQEEAVVLVESGICHFIHIPHAYRPPTSSEIAAHTSTRIGAVHDLQLAAWEASEEKKRVFSRSQRGEGAGRGERGKKDKGEEGVLPIIEAESTATATESLFTPPASTRQPAPPTPTTTQPYFTIIPSHPHPSTHPWFASSSSSSSSSPSTTTYKYTSLPAARKAGVWTYPSTPLERARCAVYRRLWEEGMFMGQGVKFGGEFLVYPGDPLRYHSHFVTTTLPTSQTPIRPLELVAWGRLGTATKKAHLVCCVDLEAAEAEAGAEEGEGGQGGGEGDQQQVQVQVTGVNNKRETTKPHGGVQFYSLEWANFG